MTIAWYDPTSRHVSTDKNDPLFTPLGQLWPLDVQRTWVGLTDEEIALIDWESLVTKKDCVQTIEAKSKEKNNG